MIGVAQDHVSSAPQSAFVFRFWLEHHSHGHPATGSPDPTFPAADMWRSTAEEIDGQLMSSISYARVSQMFEWD